MNTIARFMLVAALLFMGCSMSPNSLGGGTDFPNSHSLTADAMGKNLSDHIANANQWGDSVALVDTPPDPALGIPLAVPTLPTSKVLAKTAVAARQTLTYDSSSAATLGIVRAYYTLIIADSLTENDTMVLLYDAAFRDAVPGNEHIYSWKGEKVFAKPSLDQHYSFIDADGDSIINNRNGRPNRVALNWSSTDATGIIITLALIIDGGADNDLATGADNYSVYQAMSTVFPSGKTVIRRVRGVHADSLYFAGDSVIAERVIDSGLIKTTDTLRYIFIKGPDPRDNSGNRLLTMHRHIIWPSGIERERIFTLTVDSPVAPDKSPDAGPLYMRQVFSDGYWLQLDGSFNTQVITGNYSDSNGKIGTLTWDRAGAVK